MHKITYVERTIEDKRVLDLIDSLPSQSDFEQRPIVHYAVYEIFYTPENQEDYMSKYYLTIADLYWTNIDMLEETYQDLVELFILAEAGCLVKESYSIFRHKIERFET